jgi:hypothetical protein
MARQVRGKEGATKSESRESTPWSVYVCTVLYKQPDHHVVSPGTGSMEREYAVDDRIDRLTMREGVFREANVSGRGSGMETEMWDF